MRTASVSAAGMSAVVKLQGLTRDGGFDVFGVKTKINWKR